MGSGVTSEGDRDHPVPLHDFRLKSRGCAVLIRGNRHNVPDGYAGRIVAIRIDFKDLLTILDNDRILATWN